MKLISVLATLIVLALGANSAFAGCHKHKHQNSGGGVQGSVSDLSGGW